jgi:hypothetical protein
VFKTICDIEVGRPSPAASEEQMTSEEMNRAIEFMIQHQAQLAIEMEGLAKLHKRDHELLAQLTMQGQRMSELIVIESERLDRAEQQTRDIRTFVEVQQQRAEKENRDITKSIEIQQQRLDRAEQEDRAAQKRHDQLMQELRDRLDRIFEKLS